MIVCKLILENSFYKQRRVYAKLHGNACQFSQHHETSVYLISKMTDLTLNILLLTYRNQVAFADVLILLKI